MATLHPRVKEDLTDREFGLLTVKEYVGHGGFWRCKCACGRIVEVSSSNLQRTGSCGCDRPRKVAALKTKHGHATQASASPEYRAWLKMIERCEQKDNINYHNYGGRGIKICRRWREDFTSFLADMGPKPVGDYSIERRDNDGDYEPGNCRWATRKEQTRNMRTNRLLTLDGETKPLTDWAPTLGLSPSGLARRLARGWDLRRALTTVRDDSCVNTRYAASS
jgi:hypothetical protein